MNTSRPLTDLSTDEKRALLSQLLRKSAGTPVLAPSSFAQQRLWFLDQLEPGVAVYNVPAAVRLEGPLQVKALAQTLSEVVRRHEVLRTTFAVVQGEPVQVIGPAEAVGLPLIDLRQWPESEREAEAQRLAREEAQRPFDLRLGPLLRARLVQLSEREHLLLFTMHHIISDGWSAGLMLREVTRLYEAYAQGQSSPLSELGIQYADYAVWQREWLQGGVLEEQLSYWREQLQGAPGVLELPTDRARPAVQSFRGARQRIELSAGLTEQLKALSQREEVTLFMTLLAAFQVLLWRYTGETDIVVGAPIANRNRAETESLIGFFVNMLVLRTDLSGAPSFRELLQRVREVALGAYAHQDIPFEKLVEELQPERNLNRQPLFQVTFALQNAPMPPLELAKLKLTSLELHSLPAKFDLKFDLWESAQGLSGTCIYNTDLFDEPTISRMVGHYEELLKPLVRNPEQRIREIGMLPGAEERELVAWNERGGEYPSESSIAELFEEQVERRPEQIALVSGGEELSYGELNGRANQLAHYLRGKGVGAEVLVGVLLERSLELVVSVLGILKAGGAYVPLDPEYPGERVSYMIADAGVKVLLSELELVQRLPEQSGAEVVCLEEAREEIGEQSRENVESGVQGDNAAYVIYTSGSSGRPKGVVVSHHNVTRLFAATKEEFEFSGADVWTLFHSYAFDFSVWEMWGALLHGGRLVVVPQWVSRTPAAFAKLLREARVTVLNQTPSAFGQLLKAEERGGREGQEEEEWALRLVIFGGEALESRSLAGWYERPGAEQVRLVNMYGITETTVHVTCGEVDRGELGRSSGSNIGQPLADMQVYVLDQYLGLTPIGIAGELYVGGAGLARGYLNRAELTGERFIPHPFSRRPGARLYRTGDKGRYLRDGQIEFLGRIDQQVKIRGYRVELGEIEAVLSEHPAVRETVTIAREDAPGEQRLVAYIVSAGERPATVSELGEYLRAKLPAHMIPGGFVLLAELPLTPNGKVDRKALPAPEQSRPEMAAAYVGPRTAVEEIVAGIWAEVLRVERVGVHDNFFELGGHSLLATQVISRVREACGVEVGLRRIFESATVAGLAGSVEEELKAGGGWVRPVLERVARGEQLPLSFAQQRLWFLDQLEPGGAVYNVPAAVRLEGPLNVKALEQTLSEVVRRHEGLRTTFEVAQGEPVQVIGPAEALGLPLIDLSQWPESERAAEAQRLAREEAQRPFDLRLGPLLRARLVRLSEREHLLLFTMHHIISDGWSVGVLLGEVTSLYEAYAQGQKSPLAELGIQYADYAVWQREWLQGAVLEEQLSYWREQLQGAPGVLELPTDRARPAVQSFRGARQRIELSKELSEELKRLSQREEVTLFMTLLAAFQVLLWRYTGETDIVVGAPIANRNRAETESLIGFFVNMLVLRTDLSGAPSFRELLQRVREVALGAYAHQDIPFEMLVEELRPEREMSHTPLFQVIFALQNAPRVALQLSGLSVCAVAADSVTAQFDLGLSLEESEEGIVGVWRYNTDLYDQATIARMSGHLQVLLAAIADDAAQRITELPMLTAGEERQLLVEWNETEREYSRDQCLHQLFEQQVERTPEHIALVFAHEQMTYRELNRRANQLAHYLRGMGVGAEVLVGLMMERSIEMVVALLGILKAGGAYVPLDPEYPFERLSFMLEDAKVSVLVTQERLVETLAGHEAKVVCLDSSRDEIAKESKSNPVSGVMADNPAYVIYTSGSTGKPKGVVTKHRGVCAVITSSLQSFSVRGGSRVLQLASLSFDASVLEICLALLSGSTLYLIDRDLVLSGTGITKLLREEAINIIALAPTLLDTLPMEPLPDLSTIIVGGESCSVDTARRWSFGRRFFNAYAPTEATIYATVFEWGGIYQQCVPVGQPISNAEVYILSRQLKAVPVGIAGELYIGGVGLARGYLHRPELTAERFIPHPFSRKPGARLYRTGDMARYLRDGNLEFLGRIDHQVKLRGYRIELGEIEGALSEHPAVSETVVVARDDETGSKRLVAYVVSTEAPTPTTSALWQFLKQKLPSYMIPSAFVLLDELPLTASGKVNREALPAPEQNRPEIAAGYVEPRTPVEEILAAIWADLLRVERVGVEDNFFELGGDSILAIQIIARANEAGLHLTPKLLFQNQTIAELAAVVATAPLVLSEQDLVTGPVPLTPIQHQFFDQNLTDVHHFNQAVLLAVRHGQTLDAALLDQVVRRLLMHHDALRLRFVREDSSKWRQINAGLSEDLPFTRLDLSQLSESGLASAIEAEALGVQSSLCLTNGPIMRVVLFDLGASRASRLLIVIHHLAVDGVSWRLLLEDLQRGYEQVSRGAPIKLPPKTTSFKRWAERLVKYAQSEALQSELAYWLSIPQRSNRLPLDYPEGTNTEALARNVSLTLDVEQTRALLQEVPAVYHTEINDVLLTALVQSFTQWTGVRSLSVDLEGHGREEQIVKDVDLLRTVGWFTTLFPVELQLGATRTPGEALKSVKEQLRAIPNRGIGYGVLRYLSVAAVAEKLRRQPQSEVSFNYLGQFDQVLPESSLFIPTPESSGPTRSLRGERRYVLEISGSITQGQLRMTWRYSEGLHHHATLEALAQRFIDALKDLIAHCLSEGAGGYTPSDFPEVQLSQKELDDLIAETAEPFAEI